MKRRITIFACAILAATVCAVLARAATTAAYNSTLAGFQSASGEGVAVVMDATGDLRGMMNLKLTHEGGRVTGGEWTLTVLPSDADAASAEKGNLAGVVSGGNVTLKDDRVVTALSAISLSVRSGTGQYEDVTGGDGTMNLKADVENPSRLGGTLVLNF